MLSVPSWDLFLSLFFFTITAYGFILNREKVTVTILSTYVSLVVATAWGPSFYHLFTGNTVLFNQLWFRTNVSQFTVQLGIFAVFMVLLSLKSEISGPVSKGGGILTPIFVLIFSLLNAGLIIISVVGFLAPAGQAALAAQSRLADFILHYRLWWIVLPAVMMIVAGFKNSPAPRQEEPR